MDVLATQTAPPRVDVARGPIERPAGRPRIAILDADEGFVRMLVRHLERLGWDSIVAQSSPHLSELLEMRLSCIVLDPAVLGAERWTFLERVGREAPEIGLVVCTAPAPVAERIRGLHLGADDWMAKPCHAGEAVARIESILRRSTRATARLLAAAANAGELEIDNARFQAFVDGRSVDLTRREFELLRLLAAMPDKVLTREEIYERIWGFRMAHGDRSVDVFVRKVRLKLERHSPGWRYIHTHVGVGYRFEAVPSGDQAAR